MMAEDLDREEGATDRPDNGVDRVPGGIDPRDFICEKFEQIQNTGDGNDPWLAKDFERLVLRRERDPMEVNGKTGDEDREIKVDAGEAGEAERHADDVESVHGANIGDAVELSCAFLYPRRSVHPTCGPNPGD